MAKYKIIMTVNHEAVIEAEDDIAAEKIAVECWEQQEIDDFSFHSLHSMWTDQISEEE
jgi:hypothetical protein